MIDNILNFLFGANYKPEEAKIFFSVVGICFLTLFLIILIIAYIWHVKEIHDGRQFTVTREGLGEQSGKIKDILMRHHAGPSEVNSDLLLLEELIMRLQEHAENAVTVRMINRFGHFKLSLSVRGKSYNPLKEDEDAKDNGENYLRGMILQAKKSHISYKHSFGKNIVMIEYKYKE